MNRSAKCQRLCSSFRSFGRARGRGAKLVSPCACRFIRHKMRAERNGVAILRLITLEARRRFLR